MMKFCIVNKGLKKVSQSVFKGFNEEREKVKKQDSSVDAHLLTDQEIAQHIFSEGLSTAASVSHYSGRGMGMEAVKRYLIDHGARIEIALSEMTTVTRGRPFAFLIYLPEESFIRVASDQ